MSSNQYVSEVDSFFDGFKKKATSAISGFNGEVWQSKSWEREGPRPSDPEQIPYTWRHYVNASRGEVFEKATVSEIYIKWERASSSIIERGLASEGDPVDVRVLQVEIFPRSPFLPMGHFNMERFCASNNQLIVNLDVFPASTPLEEVDAIREQMDKVAKSHGKDQKELCPGLAEQYNMDGWRTPLAGRAGFQIKMLPLEEYYPLARDGAETFLNFYMEMVKKLKDRLYNEQDEELMNEMRSHWLEYSLMKDGAVRMARERGHPFDAMRWMGMPPTIHY